MVDFAWSSYGLLALPTNSGLLCQEERSQNIFCVKVTEQLHLKRHTGENYIDSKIHHIISKQDEPDLKSAGHLFALHTSDLNQTILMSECSPLLPLNA